MTTGADGQHDAIMLARKSCVCVFATPTLARKFMRGTRTTCTCALCGGLKLYHLIYFYRIYLTKMHVYTGEKVRVGACVQQVNHSATSDQPMRWRDEGHREPWEDGMRSDRKSRRGVERALKLISLVLSFKLFFS